MMKSPEEPNSSLELWMADLTTSPSPSRKGNEHSRMYLGLLFAGLPSKHRCHWFHRWEKASHRLFIPASQFGSLLFTVFFCLFCFLFGYVSLGSYVIRKRIHLQAFKLQRGDGSESERRAIPVVTEARSLMCSL